MQIENPRWIDAEHSMIDVLIDGVRMNVPADPENRHYQELIKWVAAGGDIAPFEAAS